ncbi:MAG TPA: VTT domain-containing protein [Pseudomonadales bacterium]|nr:VTT domain-containing protein [Pseudomonadales bacterium]
MIDWPTIAATFDGALAGMAEPWVIAVALVLTTFLLEDLAIAAGVALATQGSISWELSLVAVAGGIALGDVGLYALGVAAHRVAWLRTRLIGERSFRIGAHLEAKLPSAVLLARVIPGLRLVTYTACGFLRVPLWPFSTWVTVAVLLWTFGLYGISVAIGSALAERTGLSPPVAVALPILLLAAAIPLWRFVRQHWRSRPA